MQTFASKAVECNVGITKDIIDEGIHSRLFKLACVIFATEGSGTFDFLFQKVVDI